MRSSLRSLLPLLPIGLLAGHDVPRAFTPGDPGAVVAFACDSATLPRAIGTRRDTLRLMARGGAGLPKLPPEWTQFRLDEISRRVVLPSPLVLDVYGAIASGRDTTSRRDGKLRGRMAPAIYGELMVAFDSGGRVARVEVAAHSLVPGLDAALVRAVFAADSLDQPLPMREAKSRQPILFLSLTTTRPPLPAGGDGGRFVRPVSVLDVPLYDDAVNARTAPESRGPAYPREERSVYRQGSVRMQFVIDETGHVLDGTARVERYTSTAFAQAVLTALPIIQFTPARIGDCPVRQLVSQEFQFKLTSSR
jgi:TonB family protein